MPSIEGFHHVSFSVTDIARSAEWYAVVLGFTVEAEVDGDGFRRTRLRHPRSGITVTLTRHAAASSESFTELRTGLDHIAFAVSNLAEVEAWGRRLDELGVSHSGVKRSRTAAGVVAMITLRDPDHIQLELFAGPEAEPQGGEFTG